MTWKAEEYEKLLRELFQRVGGADQILIQKTLEMVSDPVRRGVYVQNHRC